jgi:hypothetical protein
VKNFVSGLVVTPFDHVGIDHPKLVVARLLVRKDYKVYAVCSSGWDQESIIAQPFDRTAHVLASAMIQRGQLTFGDPELSQLLSLR